MTRRRSAAVAAAVLAAAAAPAQAGPWPAGQGHFYSKLSYGHLRSTELVAPDGTSFDIPRFTKDEVYLYFAYGVSNRVTLIANLPLLRSSDLRDVPDELSRESGFGDLQAGLQVQLGEAGGWIFAARAAAQAPTGDVSRAQGLLPTGSGIWEGEGVVGAGRSLFKGKGWGFLEAGYQYRGGGLRDGVVFGGQLGVSVHRRIALAANVRGVEPFSHEAPEVARGTFSGVGDRVTYIAYGPTAIVGLGRGVGLQVDLELAGRARNLAKGPTLRAGVSFSR